MTTTPSTPSTPAARRSGSGSSTRWRPQARDPKALEQRRLQAARRFKRGATQAEVARALGVSAQTASRWHARFTAGGAKALRAPVRQGRPPYLSQSQLRQLERALRKGAVAHGFEEELWTLRRVASVIEQLTGVTYHPGHVWRLLRGMGWSAQRPIRRAAERDEQAIARWVAEEWPAITQTPTGADPGSASSTNRQFR
jgi:transposase